MRITQTALSFLMQAQMNWRVDWLWGCPLIVITVIFHVLNLGLIREKALQIYGDDVKRRYPTSAFAVVVGGTTLLATFLHAIEAGIWAIAYVFIGTMPDLKSGMLYSLGAMTTYGHEELHLEARWRLLGTIEALSGWLLFGLSTAFLFWLIQEVSPRQRGSRDSVSK
jgi:hypothetical protein